MNKFSEGQKVVCISDKFPVIKEYSGAGKDAPIKPKVGEILSIDEILGDFLRFNKYDDNNPESPTYAFNWWHHTRFAPIDEQAYKEALEELLGDTITLAKK